MSCKVRMKFPTLQIRILLVSLAGAAVTYGITTLLPSKFESYETLYFPMNQALPSAAALAGMGDGGSSDGAQIASLGGALMSPLVASGPQTAMGILTSRTCFDDVVQALDLATRWSLSPSEAIGQLRDSTRVKMEKSGFLKLEVQSENPELSAQIVEAMHAHLDRRAGELTLNVSRRNREFIEERLQRAEQELQQARNGMVLAMQTSATAEPGQVQSAYWNTAMRLEEAKGRQASAKLLLKSIEGSLTNLVKTSKSKNDTLQALKGLSSSNSVQASTAVLSDLAAELQKRRLDLADASDRFSQQSAEFREIARSMGSIERFSKKVVDSEYEAILKGTAPQLRQAKAELVALQAEVAFNMETLTKFEQAARDVPLTYAATELAKAHFQTALQTKNKLQAELENARIAEARDPSRFEVVDEPVPNPDPVAPRKALLAGLAFLILGTLQVVPFLMKDDANKSN